jgi:hypothetical protein
MLVESMDMSIYRQAEPPAAGWDVWQVALPTPPVYINSSNTLMHDDLTSEAEEFTSVMSYTTYILVSEGHEERWMTSKSSVLLTFIKGSQVQVSHVVGRYITEAKDHQNKLGVPFLSNPYFIPDVIGEPLTNMNISRIKVFGICPSPRTIGGDITLISFCVDTHNNAFKGLHTNRINPLGYLYSL